MLLSELQRRSFLKWETREKRKEKFQREKVRSEYPGPRQPWEKSAVCRMRLSLHDRKHAAIKSKRLVCFPFCNIVVRVSTFPPLLHIPTASTQAPTVMTLSLNLLL